ncbi:hypothetical protein LSAT2_000599 [Lamellibrachia satsuma]|nr:hypothetical protein LSAT2_000599 [Lamellibrachia satsuma]
MLVPPVVCVFVQDEGLCTLASLVDESVSDGGHRLDGPQCQLLNIGQENCNRMVATAFHSTIQVWSVMVSNDDDLITHEIGVKGSEENPVTVMGTRFLNSAPKSHNTMFVEGC